MNIRRWWREHRIRVIRGNDEVRRLIKKKNKTIEETIYIMLHDPIMLVVTVIITVAVLVNCWRIFLHYEPYEWLWLVAWIGAYPVLFSIVKNASDERYDDLPKRSQFKSRWQYLKAIFRYMNKQSKI